MSHVDQPRGSLPGDARLEEGVRRRDAARRAGVAYARRVQAANRKRDLDPAKRERDLAALDPATRARVQNYGKKAHL